MSPLSQPGVCFHCEATDNLQFVHGTRNLPAPPGVYVDAAARVVIFGLQSVMADMADGFATTLFVTVRIRAGEASGAAMPLVNIGRSCANIFFPSDGPCFCKFPVVEKCRFRHRLAVR